MTAAEKTPKDPILQDFPIPILTPRLLIRPAMPGDGADVNAAIRESHEDLAQWMLWAGDQPEEVDASERNCREAWSRFITREGARMHAYDRASGKFIAGTGLHNEAWEIPKFTIGYWVRTSEQGKGYATEITNALIRYAFSALGAKRVGITHADSNDRSRRVIEKCGFQFEGRLRLDHRLPGGGVADTMVYSRLDTLGLEPLEVTWGEGL